MSAQKQNGIDPKLLFEGGSQNPETEYKDVWEIDLVKDLFRISGVEKAKYKDLKNNYLKLNSTMALIFGVLTAAQGTKETKTRNFIILENMIFNIQ